MQYSLGNMLKGGGALNPDGLALDLAFALDRSFTTDPTDAGKALITSRRGPAAKFSRGSGATQVNAAGLIEYAPENLVPRSSNFPAGSWIINAARLTWALDATGPDGLLSATTLTTTGLAGSSFIYVSANIVIGTTYTQSAILKAGSAGFGAISSYDGVLDYGAMFDLTAGVFVGYRTGAGTGTPISNSIESLGNGWWRVSMTYRATGTSSGYAAQILVSETGNLNFGTTQSAGKTLIAFAYQLERASTARTYYPTTSAAFYGPRFDHDPVTGLCKGMLIEESRTNLIADSNAFDNWSTTGSSVASSSVANPEGSLSAWKIKEDTFLSIHTVSRSFTAVSGTTYTASVWLKAAENGFAFLGLVGGGFSTFTLVSIDLSTGAVTTATGTLVAATSVAYSNGWWRVSISQVATSSASSNIDIRLSRDGVFANRSYLGNGVNGMYIYGAQVEAGAFPLSYIPTTSGTAARSADVCGPMLLGESFINQVEGTLVIELTREPIGTTSVFKVPLRVWASGATNDYAGIDFNDSAIRAPLRTNNTTIYQNNVTDTVFSGRKIAAAWQSGSSALVIDGVVRTTNTVTFVFPTPLDTLGFAQITNAFYNGRIARIQYFRKRLSNAKLQDLTAP